MSVENRIRVAVVGAGKFGTKRAMAIARKYHQGPGDVFAVLAFCLFLAGSLLTSYVIASFAMSLMNRERINFGRYGWKVAVVVMGMSWVLVPVTWSFIYNVTVLF